MPTKCDGEPDLQSCLQATFASKLAFPVISAGCSCRGLERRALLQVVSAAGAVDHSQLVQLAEKAFSGLPSSGPSSQELVTKASLLTPD